MIRAVLSTLLAYLLGSVPFSYLIVRRTTGEDVRRMGSGNPGATNVLRVAGPRAGAMALACDVLKGSLAVAVPRLLGAPRPAASAAAVAVTAGHVFPAFLGLRGGKGAATGFGALTALAPWEAAGSLAAFGGTLAATRYVSLASMAGAVTFPVLVAARGLGGRRPDPSLLAATGAVTALVLVRHGGNLRRLRSGSEHRLGERAGADVPHPASRDGAAPPERGDDA